MKHGKREMPGGGKMYGSMPGGGKVRRRLMEYMEKGGKLKMVKNDKGEMVPFFAADGKGKMEAGGKMRSYKMGQEGMKTDPPKITQREVDMQIAKLRKERDMLIGEDLVKGGTAFAEANPDMRGLSGFGKESSTAASIMNFYDSGIAAIKKQAAMDLERKPYDREEFMKMIQEKLMKKGE